jgi:hypothetical protein
MPPIGSAPKWEESLINKETLSSLRERFNQKERIAIRVPLTITPKGQAPTKSFFDVFIEQDIKLDHAEDHFIREGITIAGVSTLKQKGIRALISITDKSLSEFLGDSENPAHTEWQERSQKFKNRFNYGVSSLRFVKNSPKEIVKILSKPSLGIDKNLLEDLFSITRPQSIDDIKKPGSKIPPGDLTGSNKEFQLMRKHGGFILRKNPKSLRPVGIHITVAYETRGRDPFKAYSPFDFEINNSPIKIISKDAQINFIKENQLIVQLLSDDFKLEVMGFDLNRDLRLKVEGVG